MKKLGIVIKKASPVIGSILMFVAVYGGVKPASIVFLHQPKSPKCLR